MPLFLWAQCPGVEGLPEFEIMLNVIVFFFKINLHLECNFKNSCYDWFGNVKYQPIVKNLHQICYATQNGSIIALTQGISLFHISV